MNTQKDLKNFTPRVLGEKVSLKLNDMQGNSHQVAGIVTGISYQKPLGGLPMVGWVSVKVENHPAVEKITERWSEHRSDPTVLFRDGVVGNGKMGSPGEIYLSDFSSAAGRKILVESMQKSLDEVWQQMPEPQRKDFTAWRESMTAPVITLTL
ncbi:MAG: hypothetical protein WCD70_06445 [Alphaproteobacteria bacterium]